MFKHILVPTDGSERANDAVRFAVDVARFVNARLTALTVIETARQPDGPEALAGAQAHGGRVDQALQFATDVARRAGVSIATVTLRHEQPYGAILSASRALNCDLIVMATHGMSRERQPTPDLPLGSQTLHVAVASQIPVLVYHHPPASAHTSPDGAPAGPEANF
jgi:nucleotide-binding universal stress UspA family protein